MKRRNKILIVLLSAATLGLFYQWIQTTSIFALERLEVAGDLKELTLEEILKAANVPLKKNLFQISLSEIERNIAGLDWVKQVSVRRQVPSTLWVHVREYKPQALLLDERLHFVSEEGVVFKAVGKEMNRDLPVITGFKKTDSLDEALRIIHFLRDFSDFELFGLSEIHYNEITGFSIVTLMGPMEIRLGRDDIASKIIRLKKIWDGLENRFSRVRGIDLDYDDRAFVKL